jgi:NNP family nitrate/nitrite transporter-like MFS transporter
LATAAFGVNFWAWSLISPLAPKYRDLLALSPLAVSVMVAIPVLVGSLGRIPLGALTDRYGGRVVFTALCVTSAIPVVFLAVLDSFPALLAGGFLLGISGASFAVGIPFVNAWFPPNRRGFALGIYGVGNVGTAISGFLSPWLWDVGGSSLPYATAVVALVAMGVVFWLFGRNAPGFTPVTRPLLAHFKSTLRIRATYELAALYAVTFGGFVAFGVYLPTYLTTAYDLSVADAAARAAGFVVVATLARPVGGWLADSIGGVEVLRVVFGVVAAFAVVAAFTPTMPVLTVAMLTIAAALGAGNGAVFALVGTRVPMGSVGAVTGVVGACGGLGGFLPPIVMGTVYELTGSFAIGLMLLSDIALAALVFALFGLAGRGGGWRGAWRALHSSG